MSILRTRVGTSPLRAEHERLLRTALKRGREAPEPRTGERVDTSSYSPLAIHAAQKIWQKRMVNEYRSATVFTQLVPQLVEAQATLDVQTTTLRCAMDELRHGGLCGALVEALGGVAEVETDLGPRPIPTHPGCTPRERVMRNLLFVGCMSETIAVATTVEERAQTTDPVVRRVIDQIVGDEVLHARLGWIYVEEVAKALNGEEIARTNAYLELAFRYLEEKELEATPTGPMPPDEGVRRDGLALGVCQGGQTRELFYETVKTTIVPGLAALGFDAAGAFSRRHAA